MGFTILQIPTPPMKAHVYPDGAHFRIQLYWKGKPYVRRYYDDNFGLITRELADFICNGINADISQKGKSFDPRSWFRSSGKELQAETYFWKWYIDQDHYAPSVTRKIKRNVRLFIDYFGKTDIRDIKSGQIADFLKTLSGSPKTKRDILGLLHKILTDAWKREDLPRVPGFPSVTVPRKTVKKISMDWQAKILEAIPKRDRPIFLFMARLGLRPGEARALQWEDIDFEAKTILVRKTYSGPHICPRTKTNKEKALPLLSELEAAIKPFRGISGPVFRNEWGRSYSSHLGEIWHEARKKIDAPEIDCYRGTKSSTGCNLISKGWPIEFVMKLFGQTNDSTARMYAEADVEDIRRMLENETVRITEKENISG